MDLKQICIEAHKNSVEKGFWPLKPSCMSMPDGNCASALDQAVIAQKLALIHSEVSEALEELRKGNLQAIGGELADVVIRIGDLCGALKLDLDTEVQTKMERNKSRPAMHGKLS